MEGHFTFCRVTHGCRQVRCRVRVQGWTSGTSGGDLFRMLQLSFGYLATTGYVTANGTAVRFPVLVGEFGSALDSPEVGPTTCRVAFRVSAGSDVPSATALTSFPTSLSICRGGLCHCRRCRR